MEDAEAAVWVLDGGADLGRERRAAEKLAKRGGALTTLGSRFCVTFPDGVDPKLKRKAGRWLGAEIEERADCDVAWFPLGRGYAAVMVEPPADGIDGMLGTLGLGYVEIRRAADPAAAIRVCVPMATIGDPAGFSAALQAWGYAVKSMYEVGGCNR